MDFKNVPKKYRPMPFWSWNEKLNVEETAHQVKIMNDAGLGGFVMHARGGLQTEYMGAEWFDNVECSVAMAEKLGTEAWAYDENGWPSGFGGGIVNGKGEKYQQKYLRMEKGEKHTPRTICNIDGNHFYYEVNPFYVDTLDKEVTQDFIREIYEPYYEKCKNKITGFFTDEPQISRNGIPWSLELASEYEKAYGEDLLSCVDELFLEKGNCQKTRIKFWKLVTELFSNNFMKQIYDWCTERNLEFTGHMVCEGTLSDQLTSNGAVMPHYEYLTMPGLDWLGKNVRNELHVRQVASTAQQLGKKYVLSESFGLCGHNAGFEHFKKICEWQMVKGITRFCQHLEGYSIRGLRKRDYPTTMFYQQPWWPEYETFNETISRTGMILAEGNPECDTLIIHPQTTAWSMFDCGENKGIEELNRLFIDTINSLEKKHIQFHLGDEILIERHAKVEGATFVIGEMKYTRIVVLPDTVLLDGTKKLLDEYVSNGGVVVSESEIPAYNIVDNENITYTKRNYENFAVHYFVNSTDEVQKAYIEKGAKRVDLTNGEIYDFDGFFKFAPYDSLLVIDDESPRKNKETKAERNVLLPDGEWKIKEQSLNILTMDYCKYFFDGELMDENGYVLDIQENACRLKRPVEIRQEFTVDADFVPDELYFVMETPEKFKITINGQEISCDDMGYLHDKSFRKIPVSKYFKIGRNTIISETLFKQKEGFYEDYENAHICESELNKLTYESEIEAVYLAGNFGVITDDSFEQLENEAVRYNGKFRIGKPKNTVTLKNLEQQGYPFFAGKLIVEKEIHIDDVNQKMVFDKKGVNVIMVEVNDKFAGKIFWNPTELDLSEYLKIGKNTIRITLLNNLRNMLGPHHLQEGEVLYASPASFQRIKGVWAKTPFEWNDGYTLVEFGI